MPTNQWHPMTTMRNQHWAKVWSSALHSTMTWVNLLKAFTDCWPTMSWSWSQEPRGLHLLLHRQESVKISASLLVINQNHLSSQPSPALLSCSLSPLVTLLLAVHFSYFRYFISRWLLASGCSTARCSSLRLSMSPAQYFHWVNIRDEGFIQLHSTKSD